MSNFFVPRIDKHQFSKKKTHEKNTKLSVQSQKSEDDGDGLVHVHGVLAFSSEINPMGRAEKMPAIVASEGTTKVLKMEPMKPVLKPPVKKRRKAGTKSANPTKVSTKEFKDENSNITIKIDSHPLPQTKPEEKKNLGIDKLEQTTTESVRSAEEVIRDIRSSQGRRTIESAASDEKIDAILQQVEDHAKQWMEQKFQRPDTATTSQTSPIPGIVLHPSTPEIKVETSSYETSTSTTTTTDQKTTDTGEKAGVKLDFQINICTGDAARDYHETVQQLPSAQCSHYVDLEVEEARKREALERDLALSLDVRYDDIIYVAGHSSLRSRRYMAMNPNSQDYRKKGMETKRAGNRTTPDIHKLCLLLDDPDILLERHQIEATKLLHQETPPMLSPASSFAANTEIDSSVYSVMFNESFLGGPSEQKSNGRQYERQKKRRDPSKIDPLDIDGWRSLVEEEFKHIDCSVRGNRAKKSGRNQWRALMDFVPAKMMLKPHVVKAHIFPKYHGTYNMLNEQLNDIQVASDSDETDEDVLKEQVPKKTFNKSTLERRHKSSMSIKLVDADDEIMNVGEEVKLNRSASMPNISNCFVDPNAKASLAKTDYYTGMAEVAMQRGFTDEYEDAKRAEAGREGASPVSSATGIREGGSERRSEAERSEREGGRSEGGRSEREGGRSEREGGRSEGGRSERGGGGRREASSVSSATGIREGRSERGGGGGRREASSVSSATGIREGRSERGGGRSERGGGGRSEGGRSERGGGGRSEGGGRGVPFAKSDRDGSGRSYTYEMDEDEIRRHIAEELSLSTSESESVESESDASKVKTVEKVPVVGKVEKLDRKPQVVPNAKESKKEETKEKTNEQATTHRKQSTNEPQHVEFPKSKKQVDKHHQKVAQFGTKAHELLDSYKPGAFRRTQSLSSALHQQNLASNPADVQFHNLAYNNLPVGIIQRTQSIPNILDFDWFRSRQTPADRSITDTREWVRDIWNTWFDEVLVPLDERKREIVTIDESERDSKPHVEFEAELVKRKLSMPAVVAPAIVNYDNVDEAEKAMDAEIAELTKEIENTRGLSDSTKALHLLRRATLLRKLGQLQDALDDIKASLKLEPHLPQAYWQRHLIWLVYKDKYKAMEDLTFLLKLSKGDVAAYRSLGNIFVEMNDYTMAIVNYTQAIKIAPYDANTYFQRAEIFEKTGEMLLAMDDYATVVRLDPTRTDAILKRAMFYFNEGSWPSAIACFNMLTNYPEQQALARSYRGQANAKMGNMMLALRDLSAAIHLDPSNYENFYLRGALLRKAAPKKALQDLSVSLMLDNTEENVLALLHRGIVYTDLGRNADALADFREVIMLDHRVVCARVNIGVVLLQAYNEPKEAAKQFTIAIRGNPTYLRSYLCRADAFTKLGRFQSAANDIARAIHMNPTDHQLHLRRGKLMFELKNYEMATLCIKHIAAINKSFESSSVTQKAIVQTFLQNYDEAIEYLQAGCKVAPTSNMNMLLAKTYMKSKQYGSAIAQFRHVLELKADEDDHGRAKHLPSKKRTRSARLQGEAHYLIGKCFQEMLRYEDAIHSYGVALKHDSDNLKIFTARGYCRLKLDKAKGVEDLNRSITNTNKNFSAFLLRAAYYSNEQRYSKAILNCNEALKIQPKSVRALVCRGSLKYRIDAYKLAIDDLTAAVKLDSNCFLAFYNRGVCYQAMGSSESWHLANRDYSTALMLLEYLAEDNADKGGNQLAAENSKFRQMIRSKLYINRALLYLKKQDQHVDYANAALDLDEAAGFDSNDLEIYYTKAVCLHRLYLLDEALEDYDRCLRISPKFLPAMMGRGNAFLDAQNVVAAQAEYLRVLEVMPNSMDARIHIGFSLQACGYYKQAWAHFTEAIKLDPECHDAYAGRAISSLYLGNMEAAFVDIRSALGHENKSARLLTLCGVIYQCSHTLKSALTMYKLAIQCDDEFWPAYFNAATIYLQSRRFNEAVDYFGIVLKLEPNHSAALLNRGLCNIFLNKMEAAMDDFNQSIRFETQNSHAFYNRGMLHKMLKNVDEADMDFTAALQLNPGDYISLKRRADVRGMMGLQAEAIKDYKRALELYEWKQIFGVDN